MLLPDQKRRYPKLASKFYDQLKMSHVAHNEDDRFKGILY